MTNREKLNSMALYDLLCRMNENLNETVDCCILDGIAWNGKYDGIRCPMFYDGSVPFKDACKNCIANWLNSEYDGRW